MKLIVNLSLALVMTFSALKVYSQEKTDLEQINSQLWENFTKAFETLDHELFASLHVEDFIRVSGDSKKIKNKTEYIAGYKANWQDKRLTQTISFRFLERISNGSIASERGIYNVKIFPGKENEMNYYGKFHVILGKENGKWMILVDYDSSENNSINKESFHNAFGMKELDKY
ncbi:MAG: nuclear transport factor 2 family protein [Flavobacteriaceae bacterium]|nr:nuclear transport factor 2 family protein [Flavobacteriaceae bacterium]